jgi:hypothetical protein
MFVNSTPLGNIVSKQIVNPTGKYWDECCVRRRLMSDSTSVAEESAKPVTQIENKAARIRSSIVRLTSNSIDGLESLTSELQELQQFLKSETERVQNEIESVLAGISIIVESIAPWKRLSTSGGPPKNGGAIRTTPQARQP